jgi:hypothetical protein
MSLLRSPAIPSAFQSTTNAHSILGLIWMQEVNIYLKANVLSLLSVRKVVPTLCVEIYLSMAGAKQLVTRGLSCFRPGPYVQQWCARGTVLRCTVVLAEGGYKRGRRGGRASRSQRY